MKKPVTVALTVLSALLAAVTLTACPQSKLPDVPPTVPQPKALVLLPHNTAEI
jgi:hypothetical protein